MSETNALPGLVLGARPPEQVKNALMVLWVDAAAVVGNLENRITKLCPALDGDFTGHAWLEVFECVVDQVGKNLLHRQAIAGDIRQRLDMNVRLGPRWLMGHCRHDRFDQLSRVDADGLEFAPPF